MLRGIFFLLFLLAVPAMAGRPDRGYTARANGLDFDDDGTVAEAGVDDLACDDTSGNGVQSEDVDGDAVTEEQIYVDCDAGTDAVSRGGPDDPLLTLAYAFTNYADGPGDGEDIICFKGTCTPENLDPGVSGGTGTWTKTASGSEEYNMAFASDPVMLIGWDADNDNSYPPFDTDDTAILDGDGLARPFNFALTGVDYVEFAHFSVQDYGRSPSYTGNNCGFWNGDCSHCYFHDIEMSGINQDRDMFTSHIVFDLFTGLDLHMAAVNVNCLNCGGYFMRGSCSTDAGDTCGPVRFQNVTLTAHPDDAGSGETFSGWTTIAKPWGTLNNLEILDSDFDANVAAWTQGSGDHVTGINIVQCVQNAVVRNNLLTDYGLPIGVGCGDPSFCQVRATDEIWYDANTVISTYAHGDNGLVTTAIGVGDSGSPSGYCEDLDFTNNMIRMEDPTGCFTNTSSNSAQTPAGTISILSNTCYAADMGTAAVRLEPDGQAYQHEDYDIRNNVFAGWAGTENNTNLTYAPSTWVSDNNVWNEGAGQGFVWNGGAETDFATWKTNSGDDANSSQCDPSLVDQSTGSLHLQAGDTCAQNNGVDIATITVDIDNQTRANPPDIGADEIAAAAVLSGVVMSGVEVGQ